MVAPTRTSEAHGLELPSTPHPTSPPPLPHPQQGQGRGLGEVVAPAAFSISPTRVVIFPVMFVGVQPKFVFLCRKAGRLIWNTHNSHVIGGGSPSAWHWLPDS